MSTSTNALEKINTPPQSLKELLISLVHCSGPLRLDTYMHLCLLHPQWGYYQRPMPIGAQGAFTTAPEISQLFGEVVSAWIQDLWSRTRCSSLPLTLVELGPGKGTLMSDILKSLAVYKPNVHFIEKSDSLKKMQQKTLEAYSLSFNWFQHFSTCLTEISQPFILVANEFLDALPLRQFQWTSQGWRERLITVSDKGLMLGLSQTITSWIYDSGQEGNIIEFCPEAERLMQALCRALESKEGAALFIDYGSQNLKPRSTVQALRSHRSLSLLDAPGSSDLTAHVNFKRLQEIVRRSSSVTAWPLLTQRDFLLSLGMEHRAQQLAQRYPENKAELNLALHRLTHADEMGTLFKVWMITSKNFPIPEPFFSLLPN